MNFVIKYLIMDQAFESSISLFHVLGGLHELILLKNHFYKACLVLFIKFNYLIGTSKVQIVFDFITCPYCFYFFLS